MSFLLFIKFPQLTAANQILVFPGPRLTKLTEMLESLIITGSSPKPHLEASTIKSLLGTGLILIKELSEMCAG